MSNYSKLYWLTRLDNLHGIFVAVTVIFAIILAIWLIAYAAISSEDYTSDSVDVKKFVGKHGYIRKWSITLLVFGALGLTFLPSKTDLIVIYAGGKVMNFAESDTSLQKIPYQTTKILSDLLEKEVKNLKETK